MTTRKAEPHEVFLDHITSLLRNLLIDNPNFKRAGQVRVEELGERVQYILDEIEKTKHLIEPWKEEEKTDGRPVAMDDEDTTKSMA